MKKRLVICFAITWLLLAGYSSAQQIHYPAAIALNGKISFLIDSAEVTTYNLFPDIQREGLLAITLTALNEDEVKVNAIYRSSNYFKKEISWYALKLEWMKAGFVPAADSIMNDYNLSRKIMPEIKSYITIDEKGEFKPIENSYEYDNTKFFANIGISYTSINTDQDVASFYFSPTFVFYKNAISPYCYVGGKKSIENNLLFLPYLYSSYDIHVAETGILYERIINSKTYFFSVCGGVAFVDRKVTTYQNIYNGFFTSHHVKISTETYSDLGFPIGFNLSFPSSSALGINLKSQVTFISGQQPNINVTFCLRMGRAANRGGVGKNH